MADDDFQCWWSNTNKLSYGLAAVVSVVAADVSHLKTATQLEAQAKGDVVFIVSPEGELEVGLILEPRISLSLLPSPVCLLVVNPSGSGSILVSRVK